MSRTAILNDTRFPPTLVDQLKTKLVDGAAPRWWEDAACRGLDPDIFFPEKYDSGRDAKKVCAVCPVRVDCLADGLYERDGIWGGYGHKLRRMLARDINAPYQQRQEARCGTNAGYHWHRRNSETPCDLCSAAHSTYGRQQRAQREPA